LRLASHPVEIAATALVPDGPPICFHLRGTRHGVADSLGPERIETGWWRGPHVKRDYYRVVTEDGRRLWLFRERDTGRWFLHGWFD
jgi:protein ImuB